MTDMESIPAPTSLRLVSRNLILAVALVLSAHVPMLFSDTAIVDGAVIKYAQHTKEYDAFRMNGDTQGHPYVVEFHIALGRLPGAWYFYRLISFVCFGEATFGIYWVLRASSTLSECEAALIAAMSLLFPSLALWQEPIMVVQAMCITAFWCAGAMRLRQLRDGTASWAAHVVTTALFAFAFITESLLAYHFVLFSFLFLSLTSERTLTTATRFVRDNLWYLALPFLFFVAKSVLFPKHGRHVEYNRPLIEDLPLLIGKGVVVNGKRMIVDQFADLARFAVADPLSFAVLSVVALAVTFATFARFSRVDGPRHSFRTAAFAIGFAAAAYIMAVLPYSAVNKFPLLNSIASRHSALIYVPLSAAFVILLRNLTANEAVRRYVLAAVLGLLTVLTLRNHMALENHHVKLVGITENLRGNESQLADVVVFRDRTKLGVNEPLRTFDSGWVMYQAFNNRRHLGFDARLFDAESIAAADQDRDFKAMTYRDYRFDGRISRVNVELRNPQSEVQTYLNYLFRSSDDRKQYARSLIKLHIEPPSPPGPDDYRSSSVRSAPGDFTRPGRSIALAIKSLWSWSTVSRRHDSLVARSHT